MATSRPVRIGRSASDSAARATTIRVPVRSSEAPPTEAPPVERRRNVGGSQRAIRVSAAYLVILAALYVGFVVYDRGAPGGGSSTATTGILVLSGIFAVFAVGGAMFTLHPAIRTIEVSEDHVTVVGRWGRHRILPPLGKLSFRVARRYREGLLSSVPVAQVELWAPDVPMRTYLVDTDLFTGAHAADSPR